MGHLFLLAGLLFGCYWKLVRSNKMTQGFDEYHKKQKHNHDNIDDSIARLYFKAGATSRQAEVDELKKRIDNLNNWCILGVKSNMLSVEYNQALLDVIKIIKGEK